LNFEIWLKSQNSEIMGILPSGIAKHRKT